MPDAHPADGQVFPVRPEIAANAHVTAARYQDMFERAAREIKDRGTFSYAADAMPHGVATTYMPE